MAVRYNQDYHEEEVLGKSFDRVIFKRLLGLLKPYRLGVLLGIFFLIAGKLSMLLLPFVLKEILEVVELGGREGDVLWLGAIGFGTIFMMYVFSFLERILTSWIGLKVIFNLRKKVFSHIQKLHMGFFDRTPVGRLVTRSINDIDVLNEMFGGGVVTIMGETLIVVGIVVSMFMVNAELALFSLMVFPPLLIMTSFFRVRARRSYRKIRSIISALNRFSQENYSGMSTVQIFGRSLLHLKQFRLINDDHKTGNVEAIRAYSLFFAGMDFFSGMMLIFFIAAGSFLYGGEGFNLSTFLIFSILANMLFRPLRQLCEQYNVLQSAMASAERIFELLDTPSAVIERSTLPFPKTIETLEFRDVHFSYNKKDKVLKGISFKLQKGESLALVGSTGGGKTTVASLLGRLYEVDRGEILINGRNILDYELSGLRKAIGVVLQDPFIFSGSITRNIALRSGLDFKDVKKSAEYVNASKFIEDYPDAYDEILPEQGSNLSVGQKQLIAFARTLAHEPELMVMDEATSNIDTLTEKLIQGALGKILDQGTSIIIAHRLSTIRRVDNILVIHHGRVVESGKHEELMGQDGLYKKLYELQFRSQEVNT